MVTFSEPSDALAARILGELGFQERFVGTKITPMAGNRVFSIYSFEEAVDFFHMDSLEDLLTVGSRSSVGYLELAQLRRWVESVFKDRELAEEMGKEIEKDSCYMDKMKNIKELMQHRLCQCKEVAANQPEEE